jgi:hypothetical protein
MHSAVATSLTRGRPMQARMGPPQRRRALALAYGAEHGFEKFAATERAELDAMRRLDAGHVPETAFLDVSGRPSAILLVGEGAVAARRS